jgi:hypothetical protein
LIHSNRRSVFSWFENLNRQKGKHTANAIGGGRFLKEAAVIRTFYLYLASVRPHGEFISARFSKLKPPPTGKREDRFGDRPAGGFDF